MTSHHRILIQVWAFLNHMLTLFTFHSGLSLNIEAQGDIDVDDHHVTEDIGIVIGQLLLEMIKDKKAFRSLWNDVHSNG